MARCDALVAIDILGGVEILTQLESFMECDVACRFQAILYRYTNVLNHFFRRRLLSLKAFFTSTAESMFLSTSALQIRTK